MKVYAYVLIVSLLSFMATGCSVGMALSGEEQKDMSIVMPGIHRDVVIAKLGPPETSSTNADNHIVETWVVVKGNAPNKDRAVTHAVLDVVTLGIWEVVGTPIEMGAANEERIRYTVTYNDYHEVMNVKAAKIE